MTRYFLKVTTIPTETNPIKTTRVEYYGKRSEYLSNLCTPSEKMLMLFGFGSYEAAELEKKRRQAVYDRDYEKFHTYTHTIEILSEDVI